MAKARRVAVVAFLLVLLLGGFFLLGRRRALAPGAPGDAPAAVRGAAHRRARRAAVTRPPLSIPRFVLPPPSPSRLRYPPSDLYDTESREDPWALQMESALRAWMAPEVLAGVGLSRLEITDLSCRQTACRMVIEFPTSLRELVTSRGLPPESPLWLVTEVQGPVAPMINSGRPELLARDGESYTRETYYFGFNNHPARDPRRQPDWARRQIPKVRATIEKMRERWEAWGGSLRP